MAAFAGALLTVAALLTGFTGPAQAAPAEPVPVAVEAAPADVGIAATLWHCRLPDPHPPGYRYAPCTRIKSAPASGVQVLDRTTGRVVTLYNGNSVYLSAWALDTSGKCGVGGVPYVWWINWLDSQRRHHWALIGDYYLATGSPSTWKPFPMVPGGLWTLEDQYQGTGRGACTVFPNG